MLERKKNVDIKKVDTKEFQLPETLFIRDIDNKVFQGIVLECLNQIDGVTLIESTFIDSILGRSLSEGARGIQAEQDNKNHSVGIKLEVNIFYGVPIPDKAEEIQSKIAEEITRLTGLHVSSVHVLFKNIITGEMKKPVYQLANQANFASSPDEYSDEF